MQRLTRSLVSQLAQHKRRARMAQASLKARTPKAPDRAEQRYLVWANQRINLVQDLIRKRVLPHLSDLLENLPESPSPRPSVSKQDSHCPDCGGLPEWYQACYRYARVDTARDRRNHTFGQLELAITELTKPGVLAPGLAAIAGAIDQHSREEMSRVLALDVYGQNKAFAQEFIHQNTLLIRSVSFQQLDLVEDLMNQAIPAQWDVRELAKQIEGSFDVTRARSKLIARDQVLKANSNLNQGRQRQAGVREYIWTTSRDERVRGNPGGKYPDSDGNHYVLDKTRQSWDSPPIVNRKRGDRAHPGEDYQCRCTATPVIEGFSLEGI